MTPALRLAVAVVTAALPSGLAATGAAHPLDAPRMELFIAVVSGNGCRMSDAVADATLPQYGFTRHETRQIVAVLMQDGRAEIDRASSTLRLDEEDCF